MIFFHDSQQLFHICFFSVLSSVFFLFYFYCISMSQIIINKSPLSKRWNLSIFRHNAIFALPCFLYAPSINSTFTCSIPYVF
jgi:hypothetical protein